MPDTPSQYHDTLLHTFTNLTPPPTSSLQVANYQRDGPARIDGNQNGAPNYFPNSFGGPEPVGR